MARFSHPPQPVDPPLYRGVSDIAGTIGDPIFGTIRRSINTMVLSGTSFGKRPGYLRAIDERFVGGARSIYLRDGSSRYLLVADGDGLKVLDALPASPESGITEDDAGFVNDDFDRSNSVNIATVGKPWLEGQDSAEVAGRTVPDSTEISGNKLRFNRATNIAGAVDWNVEAPTPFHSQILEFDLTSVGLASGSHKVDFFAFIGLPDAYANPDTGAISRERMFAIDAALTWKNSVPSGQDVCWTGVGAWVTLTRLSSGDYKIELRLGEFASSQEQASFLPRAGRVFETKRDNTSTSAQLLTNWTLQFGRELAADENGAGYRHYATLWRNKSLDEVLEESPTGAYLAIHGDVRRLDGLQSGSWRWNLPLTGRGGYFGSYTSWAQAGTGTLDWPEIVARFNRLELP